MQIYNIFFTCNNITQKKATFSSNLLFQAQPQEMPVCLINVINVIVGIITNIN